MLKAQSSSTGGSNCQAFFVFLGLKPLGLLLLKGGHGIFLNLHEDNGVCCAHTGNTGIDESAQVLTQND